MLSLVVDLDGYGNFYSELDRNMCESYWQQQSVVKSYLEFERNKYAPTGCNVQSQKLFHILLFFLQAKFAAINYSYWYFIPAE